ncbi:dehydrodolichyl diphosphate synthase 6-like [Impatiens glandulifera]|uniref:dehydrodolichyl diphosphate synthase 6-like n=1 Tax=Impatiens glandulifera TaxID=253017 RepID=UPI001FB124DE|nr:dehydrodolichyl diphosphate synthase 6-like [Impatiens glandulifera]
MESGDTGSVRNWIGSLGYVTRRMIFSILSVGPLPNHIAFIMDGNRRYSKKHNLGEGGGHRAGFIALMSLMKYCYELGLKYVTIFAFSIDNFRRRPAEVQSVMDLMQEKIEGLLKEASVVDHYGVRIRFVGDLKLLHPPVREAAEKVMRATANNNRTVLLICVAYTSSYEIVHAVEEACHEKFDKLRELVDRNEDEEKEDKMIKLVDIEKHAYMAVAPDPDILVRSSGETRLSNFLLWQTTNSLLYSPMALWPEMGFTHIVWAVLNYQRRYAYFEKLKKQI